MNETIFENNGTIDKFIGDAIMVLFGAPVPMTAKEQAENAARCARAMQAGMVLVNENGRPEDSARSRAYRYSPRHRRHWELRFCPAGRLHRHRTKCKPRLKNRIRLRPRRNLCLPEISELLSPELTEQAGEYELKGISGKTSL